MRSSFTHTSQLKGAARTIADEGFAAGYAASDDTCINPYEGNGLAAELYADGFRKGLQQTLRRSNSGATAGVGAPAACRG